MAQVHERRSDRSWIQRLPSTRSDFLPLLLQGCSCPAVLSAGGPNSFL